MMRCVLLCLLDVLKVLEVTDVMRRVLSLYAGGGGGRALFAGGVGRAGRVGGDAPCAICMLEAVEDGLCLLEVVEVPEVIRCVLSV